MSTTYTQGPWGLVRLRDKLYVEVPGNMICDMQREEAPPEDQSRIDADARLIAAAPELLGALKEILGYLGGKPGVMHLPCIHQGRNAIAKAEMT